MSKTNYIQLFETYSLNNKVFYHGSRTELPFEKFEKRMDGSGIVSIGNNKYGGFFFTDNKDNAEYYTEYYICQVKIKNLKPCSPDEKHPSTVLKKGIEEKCNYVIDDILDGHAYSDVAVVPHCNLNDITILGWEFVGEKEDYFEKLDKMFGGDDIFDYEDDDDRYDDDGNFIATVVTRSMVEDFIAITGGGLEYLLTVPVFKEYYDSKGDY